MTSNNLKKYLTVDDYKKLVYCKKIKSKSKDKSNKILLKIMKKHFLLLINLISLNNPWQKKAIIHTMNKKQQKAMNRIIKIILDDDYEISNNLLALHNKIGIKCRIDSEKLKGKSLDRQMLPIALTKLQDSLLKTFPSC